MKYFVMFMLSGGLVFSAFADDALAKGPPAGPEKKVADDFRHDGVWKPKAALLSGVLLPPPVLARITLKVAGEKYEVTVLGEDEPDKGTFTLDENASPKRMTLKSFSGPNKGKTFLAIYEYKTANAMRICYDLSGKEFPKEFKAPKGTDFYLVGWRRQASKEEDGKKGS